ncbi:unnamed protein product [Thlaspi arvense]|uniref:Uncharacterized protein n=1 Tax=Thlaspi arvense TaxID=13288 RepID=A0AAU9T0U6_THLAR|nr:unnamed protein product [Thlaspi arvense]
MNEKDGVALLSFNIDGEKQAPSGVALKLQKMAGIVIIFDFDRTLIDGDSDNSVVTEMGLTEIFHQLRFTLPWNRLMDRMMTELHSQGRSIDDIEACLKKMLIDSQIVEAIKSAKSSGCDLKIVSDANRFFIEKILEQHGLLDCFSEIYTNPTSVDDDGKLRIFPYHGAASVAHSCNLCPTNLCKGLVMDHIRDSCPKDQIQRRFVYLGDGGGDFCPTLKLRECDCVMPRTNYPLWKRISDNSSLIKAQVKEWSNAEEIQKILLQLPAMISFLKARQRILSPLVTSSIRSYSSSLSYSREDSGDSQVFIHPSAVVHPSAVIGKGVSVGPYCTVGSSVKLGNGCKLYPSSHIFGNTELGESCVLMTGAVVGDELPGYTVIGGNNIIGHHAVVGVKCQDLKYKDGDECFLCIGNNNEIREFCSIHRSSNSSDKTVIGDNNLIMGSCHIAHDCKIGDRNIFANNTLLAGHVVVQMKSLRAAYRKIFMSTETVPLSLEERLSKMEQNQELYSVAAVGAMLQSIRDSFAEGRRGICKFRHWLDS